MLIRIRTPIIILCLFLAQAASAAETAYITDRIEVHLRTGQSISHKIVHTLNSGTPLTVLSRNPATGYSRVRLKSGEEGWLLSRFLSDKPIARQQLEAASQKLAELNSENERLKEELAVFQGDHQQTQAENQDLNVEARRLSAELNRIKETAANAIQIQQQRDQLQERVIHLERQLQNVKHEKQTLENSSSQDWFLMGAGVLFAGIVLGLVLPKLSWRKKSRWDSF